MSDCCEHDHLSWHLVAEGPRRWERQCLRCGVWQTAVSPRPGSICAVCSGTTRSWCWRLMTLPLRLYHALQAGPEGNLSPVEERALGVASLGGMILSWIALAFMTPSLIGDAGAAAVVVLLIWLLYKVRRERSAS